MNFQELCEKWTDLKDEAKLDYFIKVLKHIQELETDDHAFQCAVDEVTLFIDNMESVLSEIEMDDGFGTEGMKL